MIPNYLIVTAASWEELQKKINEKAKPDNGQYRAISICVSAGGIQPCAALMESKN